METPLETQVLHRPLELKAESGATLRHSTVGGCIRPRSGRDPLPRHALRRVLQLVDGGAGKHSMCGGDNNLGGTIGDERFGGLNDRATGVDEVVNEYAYAPFYFSDDAVGFCLIGPIDVPCLVDECQRHIAKISGPRFGDLDAAGIGRNNCQLPAAIIPAHVTAEDRHRNEVVDRAVEKALNLRGVQVNSHEPIGARAPIGS